MYGYSVGGCRNIIPQTPRRRFSLTPQLGSPISPSRHFRTAPIPYTSALCFLVPDIIRRRRTLLAEAVGDFVGKLLGLMAVSRLRGAPLFLGGNDYCQAARTRFQYSWLQTASRLGNSICQAVSNGSNKILVLATERCACVCISLWRCRPRVRNPSSDTAAAAPRF